MKRSDIPSLDDLRAFEAVARLGSVRLAGDHLALTHGAISRRINKLSEDLGIGLFERSGRRLRLTPAGETLHLTLGRFFAELTATVSNLRAVEAKQSALVLSCEPSVAMRWLIPRLGSFQESFPDIAVHLSVAGGPVEFRRDRIDLAIRRLDFALPDAWNVRLLFEERVGPVMAPQLVVAFQHNRYIALGSKTRPEAWPQWLAAHPIVGQPNEVRFFDHHSLAVEAASAGLGVALSPFVLATNDIERERLIAPMEFHADGTSYGLIWTGKPEQPDSISKFSNWLEQECEPLNRGLALQI